MEIKVGKSIITDTELHQKTLTKKQTIPLTEIREIKYNPPGTLKGGTLVITPYYQNSIIIGVKKKHKENAQQAYEHILNIAEQNQPPISELEQDTTLNPFECNIKEEKQTTFSGTTTSWL